MKILIVYSGGIVFRSIAERLYKNISKFNEVEIAHESVNINFFELIRQRIKREGLFKACDQIVFKVIDLLVLRKKIQNQAVLTLKDTKIKQIGSLNSIKTSDFLRENKYDYVIAIATSIIKKNILEIPKNGFLNIHPGILPKYRGAGNFWAVFNKDFNNIGCTVHWMTEKIDSGRILLVEKLTSKFHGLWDMNYDSYCAGVDSLAHIINQGSVFDVSIEYSTKDERYYGWNGIFHYLKFINNLKIFNK